jgi:glycosyltransferase involved in cell wall biosynthesis
MKILIVINEVIPVKLYGGTGRVMWYLGKELDKLGHKVTFLVKNGSFCDFANVIFMDDFKDSLKHIPNDVDIVHFNFTPQGIEDFKKPYIITLHGNLDNYETCDLNTVFVSENHANRHGSNSYVYNGLDWDDYMSPDLSSKRDYFHFLGNAAWRIKNVKGAIDVIKSTKSEKLKVLGGVRFNVSMGLRFTFSPRISFYGMVGGATKDGLLNHSKGLVFPVKWHEPFGLAIIESLYFGCPVFATPYGALPELVPTDVGYLSNKKTELTEAVNHADAFSKQRCHDYAVETFNSKKMAYAYLEKYEKALSNVPLNAVRPQLKAIQETKFLPWT